MNSLQTYRQNPDRQELFFCCWTTRYTGEFWWTGSIFLYMMSMICRKKESWRFCMLLVDQLMVLCVLKKEFRNETIWSLPDLLAEA